ncbi:putative ribonuclease H1 isoform X2 [Penaeus vannamei]|uniref:ribonuclease H n=1 Tax=Penaeus vannamei TaxID=6689 RepID=A0A423U9M1_PENVA|nr:putative ribonuclease H1 isoform X2 [Penaeus vannamei]
MPFYAVARGHSPGVYTSWPDAQAQINGYTAARYKKFDTKDEAEEFVKENALKASGRPPREKASGDSQVDDEGYLVVYSVGVCEFHGKSGQKSGCGVFFAEDHERNVSVPLKGKASNNAADIQAATHALITAKAAGYDKVAVHTDSQFMINCMTSWLKNWKKKDWKKSDGESVKNKEELIELDKATEGLAVKWIHVKAKSGIVGNDEARKLAKVGAKQYEADA